MSSAGIEATVPFRHQMRLLGISGRRRSKKPKRRRAEHCAKCSAHESEALMTTDHIIPRAILDDVPEVRDDRLNKQTLCQPCNGEKGHGPAVDYRGDPVKHERLVRLAEQHGVDVEVELFGHVPVPL